MNISGNTLYLLVTHSVALFASLIMLASVSGCASMFRECIRTESRTVQVCERREENGHCAHYSNRSQTYCAERAPKNNLY
ncbi:MAG: hypothetical protein AAGE85_12605 [Pseudomonadota bacterium]